MLSETNDHRRRADGKRPIQLARGLGWFSVALGIAEIAAPRTIARAIGIECDPSMRLTTRIFGVREIAAGAGVLARPDKAAPVWARVAGDALDLAALGHAGRTRLVDERRLLAAIGMIIGVTALDVYTATRLRKLSPVSQRRRPETRLLTITVNLPLTDVQRRWRGAAGPLAKRNVTFRQAPGGRGTEICLRFKTPSLLSQVFNRVVHTDAEQLADGDLRKVKQLLELGEIVHSDASVRRGMHAARPASRDLHLAEAEGAREAEPREPRRESETTTFTTEVRP